ncbi:NACHT domain-containing protein [Micromonospora sp. WMMD998]|uniref:NACHT domain-containing protein n=1 Tax=Micromonospora sp. WMMD998 TaxID=3016092 RepID=UPI00249CA9B9|nr:NACHT domain-containing protein [Micromonospora sp. WMMD998]
MAAVVLSTIGLLILAVIALNGKLQAADALASVISGTCLLVGAIAWAMGLGRPTSGASDPDQLDLAAKALAEAVEHQWTGEAVQRGVRNSTPASLRWSFSRSTKPNKRRSVSLENRILGVWRAARGGRLVVVGPAGSGKSVFAMLLLLSLVRTPKNGEPTPVLLSLAPWDPNEMEFDDWAIRRLKETYQFLSDASYGGAAAEGLVRSKRLLFILDGFDELSDANRSAAVASLNRTVPADRPLVVTARADGAATRPQDFGLAGEPSVLTLQSLSPESAITYLEEGRPGSFAPVYGPLRDTSSPVGAVLRMPLYAAIVKRLATEGALTPSDIAAISDDVVLRTRLIAGFLRSALASLDPARRRHPTEVRVRRKHEVDLRSTARYLVKRGGHNLRWWRLHDSIPARDWALAVSIVAGLLYGLTAGLPSGLRRGTALGFTVVVIFGLSRLRLRGWRAGVLTGVASAAAISVVGAFQIGPVPAMVDGVELGLALGIVAGMSPTLVSGRRGMFLVSGLVGLALGLMMGTLDAIEQGPVGGLVRAATTGLGSTLVIMMPARLIRGLGIHEEPPQPGRMSMQLMGRARPLLLHLTVGTVSGMVVGLSGGVVAGVRYTMMHGAEQGLSYGVRTGFVYGLSVGVGIGLMGGLVKWFSLPSSTRLAASPVSTLRTARAIALAYLLVPAVGGGVTMLLLAAAGIRIPGDTAGTGAEASPLVGLMLGASLGLVFATAFTPWPTYLAVCFFDGLLRRRPFGRMKLWRTAHEQEIFRQEGASYQFRHVEIRDTLARS